VGHPHPTERAPSAPQTLAVRGEGGEPYPPLFRVSTDGSMPRPPRDPDDLDAVMHQVADALDQLEVVDGAERTALMTELRGVLSALDGLPIGAVEIRTIAARPELEPPSIAVLDGGRGENDSDGDPLTPMPPRPPLRLAPDHDEDPDTAGLLARALHAPGTVQMRRVSIGARRNESPLSEPPGSVHLAPEPGQECFQSVFVGPRARVYRLRTLSGVLRVHVDGESVAELHAGQTLDVEGRHLQVSSSEAAEGRYIRLRSQVEP